MQIQHVGVIGAGTMGNGIAHVFAKSGYNVVLCDVEQKFLDRGIATIAKNLDRELAKGKITEADKAQTLARITPVVDRTKLQQCDLVVEAATEKFEIKAQIFRKLVEVIRGLATSQPTFDAVRDLAIKLEKTPVEVNDAPGFVSNRVLMPLLNEAMFAVMEGD